GVAVAVNVPVTTPAIAVPTIPVSTIPTPTTPAPTVPAVAPQANPVIPVPTIPPAYAVQPLAVAMDNLAKDVLGPRGPPYTQIALGTGIATGVGVVVLNTRLLAWLLSVVLARPWRWKQLDPLEVLYAWEKEKARRGLTDDEDEESLASL